MTCPAEQVRITHAPAVGEVITDGTITIVITRVDWRQDGTAVYGFDYAAILPVTGVVVKSGGRTFTYHRDHDIDTFVGEDGTHLPFQAIVWCYERPQVTTTTTTTTVPETTTTTVPVTTTVPETTTTAPTTTVAATTTTAASTTTHPPEVVETPDDSTPIYDTTVAETTTAVGVPTTVGMLPETGAASDALAGTAGALVLVGVFLAALAKRWAR